MSKSRISYMYTHGRSDNADVVVLIGRSSL